MTEDQRKYLQAMRGQNLHTRPRGSSADDYYREQEESLAWGIDQAVSRGLIDFDSGEEAKNANDRTWFDKALGFHDSSRNGFGAWGQGIIDVLSLGNYAAAATTQATISDPLIELGSLKLGFTPSAWKKAWSERTTYSDIMSGAFESKGLAFGAGLAFDIGLDPLTYLTFGVGSGVKVGSVGGKVGSKIAPAGKLTLTNYGSKIYQLAANRLRPVIEAAVKAESDALVAAGKAPKRWMDPEVMIRLHDDIGRYMVENYDQLAADAYKLETNWERFKGALSLDRKLAQPSAVENPFFTRSVEDLFQETARRQHVDIGTNLKNIAGAIESTPVVGRAFKAIAPNFSRLYGVPDDIKDVWYKTKHAIERGTADRVKEVQEAYKGLSRDELHLVTQIIEGGEDFVSSTWSADQKTMLHVLSKDGNAIDQKVMDAVEWTRNRFNDIAARETEAGFKIETAKDYVMKVYKTRTARKLVMNNLNANPGISNFAQNGGFQMHRTIAQIDQIADVLGKGLMETNIGAIVSRREAASARMIEMEKFYDYIKATSGISPLMVYQATEEGASVASMLKKIIKSQKPKENMIMDIDQLMSFEEARWKKLGFKTQGENLPPPTRRNLSILDELSEPFEKRVQSNSLNSTAIGARQISRKISMDGHEIDYLSSLRNLAEESDGPSILDEIANIRYAGDVSQVTFSDVKTLLSRIDKKLRNELESPLIVVFPDLEAKVEKLMVKAGYGLTRGPNKGRLSAPARKTMKGLMEEINKPVKTKGGFVAQLPEEFVLRAKMARIRYGDYSDMTSVAPSQGAKIQKLADDMGLHAENLSEISEALVGKKHISDLSGRDADRLIEFMLIHADKKVHKQTEVYTHLFETELRRVTFGSRKKPFFEKISAKADNSIKDFERAGLDEKMKIEKHRSLDARIENEKKKLEAARITLESNKVAQTGKVSFPGGEIRDVTEADKALRVSNAENAIRDIEENIAQLEAKKKAIPKGKEPVLERDERQFISSDEVLARDADRLTDQESSFMILRRAFKREKAEIRRLVSGDKTKAAFEAAKALNKTLRPLRSTLDKHYKDLAVAESASKAREEIANLLKEIEGLDVRIHKKAEKEAERIVKNLGAGDKDKVAAALKENNIKNRTKASLEAKRESLISKLEEAKKTAAKSTVEKEQNLRTSIADLEKQISDAMNDLGSKYESKVKIIGNGKYLDENGKVRNIIYRDGKGGLKVAGKDGEKIQEALVAKMIKTGQREFEYIRPAILDEVPDSTVGTAAGKYLIPEDVARALEDILSPVYKGENRMVDSLLKGFDRIQNMYKVPLLAPWMSSMFRNAIGNVSLGMLRAGVGILDPAHAKDFTSVLMYTLAKESEGFRAILGELGAKEKVAALGAQVVKHNNSAGVDITVAELSEQFGARGVFSAWFRDEVFDESLGDIARGILGEESKLAQMGDKIDGRAGGGIAGSVLGGSVGGPYGALLGGAVGAIVGKETYRMKNLFRFQELASEIPTRMMLALYTFKKTGSMDEAGTAVRNYLHDYSELSVFERRVMRRLIPFYNFTKLVTKAYGTTLFANPGRIIAPAKIFFAQNKTGVLADSTAMPEDMPDWLHKQLAFLGKDLDEETGKMKSWAYTGLNLPIQEVLQLTDIVMPGGESIGQFGSRTSFLATSVAEYITNYDTFRGGPIKPDIEAGIKQTTWESGTSFKGSPGWMKKLVGYVEGEDGQARVNPTMAWLLGEIPTSRFVNVAKKIYEADADAASKFNYSHLASQLFGANAYKYDPETQKYFIHKRKVNAMATALSNIQALKSYDMDRPTFEKPKKQKRRARASHPLLGG